MKKILNFTLLLIAICCIFAFSAYAEEMNPAYNEEYVKTMTQNMTSVLLEDGTSVNLYDEQGYTLCYYWDNAASESRKLLSVRTKDLTFNFNGTRLSSIYYGEEHLAGTAMAGKIVVINLRGIKNGSGQDITDFNGDNMFKESSPLQHIFMPDTIVYLTNYAFGHRDGSLSHLRGCYFSENSQLQEIKSNTFMNARQLRGFYIPKGVTYVGSNGFQGCHNAFFVNDPYDFLTKPSVYYFPEGFYKAVDEAFDSLKYNFNNVLVFTADNIEITNPFAFELVACDSNGTKPVIVFKGNVSTINVNNWNVNAIYFCNENDADATSAGASGNKTMYFCKADGNTNHLAEKVVDEEARCEVDAGKVTYCFCGAQMSKTPIEGTALSHDYDYVNGKATLLAVIYNDLSMNGTKTVKCGLCGVDNDTIKADKVFDYKGYSKNKKGSMCVTYFIDSDALDEYEQMNGALEFGFVAAANNNTPIDENGEANTNVIQNDLTGKRYTGFDFILSADDWTADNVKDVKITLNMYVMVDGVAQYITGNGYSLAAEAFKYSEIPDREPTTKE